MGLYLAGASTALSGGPLVGGILIAAFGWRAIFFINVPVAIVGVYLTLRWAAETPSARDRGVDPAGQIAAIVTVVALVVATIEGGVRGFGDPLVLAGFAAAALAGAGFVAVEATAVKPMLPLRLFRSRTFNASTRIGLLINIAFYGLSFVFSLLFRRVQHLSALQTGLALAPIMVAITAANLGAGRLRERFGPRRTIAAGALALGCGCAGLLRLRGPARGRHLDELPGDDRADLGDRSRWRPDRAGDHLRAARQCGAVALGRRRRDAQHDAPGGQRGSAWRCSAR